MITVTFEAKIKFKFKIFVWKIELPDMMVNEVVELTIHIISTITIQLIEMPIL
jgi:hypothetical protein